MFFNSYAKFSIKDGIAISGHQAINDITVFHTRFDREFDEKIINNYMMLLPDFFRLRLSGYKRWKDRQAMICGLLLLRNGLMEIGYSDTCLHQIQYDSYKRPYVKGGPDFNISHSNEYVVCAVAEKGRVGIDIEKRCEINLFDYQAYFHSELWQNIVSEKDPNKAFFDCWTKIESVLKADGRGVPSLSRRLLVQGDKVGFDEKQWSVITLTIDPDYCCNLSTDIENVTVRMKKTIFPPE